MPDRRTDDASRDRIDELAASFQAKFEGWQEEQERREKERWDRLWRRLRNSLIALAVAFAVIFAVGRSLILSDRAQNAKLARQNAALATFAHDAVQANVTARFDDCHDGGEKIRAALRAQVQDAERTDPLLYKLLPSLDTPEIHALVRERRAKQLKAYAPRDCRAFALAAVPARDRGSYRVP